MNDERIRNLKRGERGAIISIFAYLFLSALKLTVGQLANSAALRADGLNNLTDTIASIAVLFGLRYSQKPPDADHPYGHWKAEMVASLFTSFIMLAVGLQVFVSAVQSILDGPSGPPGLISAFVGAFAAVCMFGVYTYNKKLSKKINSPSIMAAAKDNWSDAMVSIGTVIGIIGAQFQLYWLDPLTAALVGLLIIKTGWDVFRGAALQLTDGFDENKIEDYRETISELYDVQKVQNIKARNYGNNTVVDITILVDPSLDIQEAHNTATKVEYALIEQHGVHDVHVHVEPENAEH
ncbi:cation transporter [Marinococcus halophilus]|uniref:Putative transporter YeaB n=1 Tax=Marinococcus halophilus TaxID=1371 RepID=A0A510YA74_MARHA|nr:cation diffusion facilitator family transporter [Marinococcus halophilus]OZT78757.1 cation transporter [Marinococcus halophilus]GEK60274.1 putative transporter YeaB [Marinococcus halophilus]